MNKKILKTKKKNKRILVAINSSEHQRIQEKADKFANGNVSLWMRYSSINHTPKESDLENIS